MNILFLSPGNKIDYQCDCLFHGLNTLPDITVYTVNDYLYMYEGNKPEDLLTQYGMGFTITNRVPKEKKHIQTLPQVQENIKSHFYDIVIYGSIYRCDLFLCDVLNRYSKDQIFFVDGEDHDFSLFFYRWHKKYFRNQRLFLEKKKKAKSLFSKGIFFKRELREIDRKYFYPISFGIPSQNIVMKVPTKSLEMATIIPGDKKTYIYKNEKDYNDGYKIARFATTFKKGGWDCMRHYEILANGCIPYFPGLEKMPSTIMVNFPKDIILETNRLYKSDAFTDSVYAFYSNLLLSYTREYLSTGKLAEYVLSFYKI
jgi:hypothetical protein